jgi:hypothetical protein
LEAEVKCLLESVIGNRTVDMRPLFEGTKSHRYRIKWPEQSSLDQLEIKSIRNYLKPVDVLKELGPTCCSGNQLAAVLADFLPLTEDDIL